jgi:ParB/RepB/Spo0J family partition protein
MQSVRAVELKLIAESPTNPRKRYDEVKLQELVESIRAMGVISPIVIRKWNPKVRTRKGVQFECVVGSRRLRAHDRLGLPTILAHFVDLTDAQVIEMQLMENAHREDVHPLEEAYTYEKLLKFDGYDIHTLALKTARTDNYVRQRLEFMKLDTPIYEMFYSGVINIGHATLLASLPADIQNDVAENHLERTSWNRQKGEEEKSLITVSQLAEVVRSEYMLQLSTAPWKLKDPDLLPAAGACSQCPKRTGASPGLFDAIELGKKDRCLDRNCFAAKQAAHLAAAVAIADAAGTPLVQISASSSVPQHLAANTIGSHDYAEVPKAKECPHSEPAIFADSTVGKSTRICRAVIHRSERCADCTFWQSPERAGKSGDLWADRARALPSKISWEQRREILRAVLREVSNGSECFPHGALQCIAWSLVPHGNSEALACANLEYVDLDTVKGNGVARELFDKYIGAQPGTPAAGDLARMTIALAMADAVAETGESRMDDLKALAASYGVNGAELAETIATRMQSEFERRRAAAKAKAKKKEKAKARAKANGTRA